MILKIGSFPTVPNLGEKKYNPIWEIYTPKWMVYSENPIKIDDLGVPLFLETPIYFPGTPGKSTWNLKNESLVQMIFRISIG